MPPLASEVPSSVPLVGPQHEDSSAFRTAFTRIWAADDGQVLAEFDFVTKSGKHTSCVVDVVDDSRPEFSPPTDAAVFLTGVEWPSNGHRGWLFTEGDGRQLFFWRVVYQARAA